MKRNYNYVIFFPNDARKPIPVYDGYQTLSLKDLESHNGISLVPYPLYHLPYCLRFIYFIINARRLRNIIPIYVKRLFYPFFFSKKTIDSKPFCFLIIGGNYLSSDYLDYLKKKYKDCKLIWFFRDMVSVREKLSPDVVHNKNIDIEMTFDIGEAKKYGMEYCPEYSSLVDLSDKTKYPLCDVFFCGKAKDRLAKLYEYYNFLTEKGLVCHFFITDVPETDQLKSEGLFYNRFMPYKEMLCRSVNAKCLLDINQLDAYGGYTSRFYEAIMYNKKLISDNPLTKESSFYNPKDIIFVKKPQDITGDYLMNMDTPVDYHYNGEFSPIKMIETVEMLLK